MTDTANAPVDIDALLASGKRIMWVAAHPDDEFLTGQLLARAGLHHKVPVHIVLMTRGGGGSNAINADDLPATRVEEMTAVATAMNATLEIHDFWNAPLPASTFPSPPEIHTKWKAQGDPTGIIADAIRSFKPDLLVTFEPTFGATGHPEHRLTSRLTTTAAAQVAAEGGPSPEVFYALRRHLLFRLMRQADPGPVDGWFDGSLPCGDSGLSCQETLVELSKKHATQAGDLNAFRKFARFFSRLGLRRVDPASAPSPDAP